MTSRRPHVAIVGAGPVGLDAALAAAEAGLPFTLYERGGAVADHVLQWGHVRLFSPWEMNLSPRMRRALEEAGRPAPEGGACPTGQELREQALEPLAALPRLAPHLRLGTEVDAIGRDGLLKHEEIGSDVRAGRRFRLLVRRVDEEGEGCESWEEADLVLDCTGTWGLPNWLGDGGIPAPGERWLDRHVERHIPDVPGEPDRWAGKTILVAGAGHSATTVLRDLARLAEEAPGTEVVWLLRREPTWAQEAGDGAAEGGCRPGCGEPSAETDPLPERGRLVATARDLYRGASPAVRTVIGTVRRIGRPATAAEDGTGGEAVAARDGASGAGPDTGSDHRLVVEVAGPDGEVREIEADRVVSLTGYVGDLDLHRQLQVHTCYATEGPMKLAAALLGAGGGGGGDCLAQESHGADALLNPEPGFFILGAKSYGRTTSFLMRLGYSQVDEVFAHLAERHATD